MHCCIYSVSTIHGTYIFSFIVETFVPLHYYFPKYVCSAPYSCFCSTLTSCFPVTFFTYFLNDFEIVPVAPIITSINFVFIVIIIIIVVSINLNMDISCHRRFLPGTSLEPAVIPTLQGSSFTLQYFPYYV